jgi:hypothetical protein
MRSTLRLPGVSVYDFGDITVADNLDADAGAGLNIDVYNVPNALFPQAQGNLTIWLDGILF